MLHVTYEYENCCFSNFYCVVRNINSATIIYTIIVVKCFVQIYVRANAKRVGMQT